MTKLMIVVGSVRPGRIGLPIAEWVRTTVAETGDFEIDFVDLAELALPLMDEPNHPALHQYTQPHTVAWSERVAAADAFVFVTPEYNHSFSPALKNALDYLNAEWWRKPYGVVSYGGISGGTRGVTALEPVLNLFGLIRTKAFVELAFAMMRVADGVFAPSDKETAILSAMLTDLAELAVALQPLQKR
ncbi:NADPH-dependent FMN reductase [Curtobacterium sp. L1-20]|uniref:NADPH-dependent FMN reductase n=1 Tax=Curtobacterium sp. L1-20 TaxID=3138181 RepID=UPI003B51BF6A